MFPLPALSVKLGKCSAPSSHNFTFVKSSQADLGYYLAWKEVFPVILIGTYDGLLESQLVT